MVPKPVGKRGQLSPHSKKDYKSGKKITRYSNSPYSEEWGGEITRVDPEPALLDTAQKIAKQELLYCRVDLVRYESEFHLMELELIEPALYFRMDPGSEIKFAKALVQRINA